jgi:DNA-binding NarL/FixJ family response regulator
MKTPALTNEKMSILIVDDNMAFVERMIGLLDDVSNVGFINVASDYEEASRMVEEEMPSLVLLDINLPGKNGIQILRHIRKAGSDCKVIMITNHADEFYRQQCRDLGADYFLDKSNDFAKVPSIIRHWGSEKKLCITETIN